MVETPGVRDGVNLILIGPMGSGKSSIARRLAETTGRRVFDTDGWVRRDQGGRTIAEIFACEGEEFFRARETASLKELRAHAGLIVATGGGIVVREDNRQLLRALGCVGWLTAHEDILFERVSRNRQRPLLQTADPRASLRTILQARETLYRECADFTVDTTAFDHDGAAAEVLIQARRRYPEDFPQCHPPRSPTGRVTPRPTWKR